MKSKTVLLMGLAPGTRVTIPETGYVAQLLSVNECRARVKIEQSRNAKEKGTEQGWSPSTEVVVLPETAKPNAANPKLPAATVIHSLNLHSRWFRSLSLKRRTQNIDRDYRIANIIEGCLCIMAGSACCDIHQWIAHRRHRKLLKRAIEAAWQPGGPKAIRELIELTISELEASQPFRSQVSVGPLPIAEQRENSEVNFAALARGRKTQAKTRGQTGLKTTLQNRP